MSDFNIVFYNADFKEFRSWIRLDIDSLTWQGRYLNEFEAFWSIFFLEGLSFEQICSRFTYAIKANQIGPITSWFLWLRNKFITYNFINRRIPINVISKLSGITVNEVAYILREFFVSKYPEFESELNVYFQIGNVASNYYSLTFEIINRDLKIEAPKDGLVEDDVMQAMEITLYKEWDIFVKKIKKELLHKNFQLDILLRRTSLKKAFRFLIEILLLTMIGLLIVYVVKVSNLWYEKYLVEKISVNEPTLSWLDGSLRFKNSSDVNIKVDTKVKAQSLDIITKEETVTKDIDRVQIQENTIFGTESEVSLTSWDELPKDFSSADYEDSKYEEHDKYGVRDTQYGNRKVFRIIMNSASPDKAKNRLNTLLEQYNVSQVDNVRPGQKVPGGIYYNIYVPRNHLKEFMAKVEEVDEAMIYETRTRGMNPPNKNRVFIWIKQI